MGLSGSGKSTLLRGVNALNPVVGRGAGAGRRQDGVGHEGRPRDAAPPARHAHRHVVFQQFGLLPWRTVRENVGLGLELAGLSAEARRPRVDAQFELV